MNADSDLETARESAKKNGLHWRHFYEGQDRAIANAWNVSSRPSTVLIDRDGLIAGKNFDYKTYDELVELINGVINKQD